MWFIISLEFRAGTLSRRDLKKNRMGQASTVLEDRASASFTAMNKEADLLLHIYVKENQEAVEDLRCATATFSKEVRHNICEVNRLKVHLFPSPS
jgi:hypothetical protein